MIESEDEVGNNEDEKEILYEDDELL
jgi:hypothetical protein